LGGFFFFAEYNLTLLMGGFCPCSAHFKVVI
jgi:hypothetical protein